MHVVHNTNPLPSPPQPHVAWRSDQDVVAAISRWAPLLDIDLPAGGVQTANLRQMVIRVLNAAAHEPEVFSELRDSLFTVRGPQDCAPAMASWPTRRPIPSRRMDLSPVAAMPQRSSSQWHGAHA